MKTVLIALRAAAYMAGFVTFFGWIALRIRRFDPSFNVALPRWMEVPGFLLMAFGAMLALACAAVFIVRGRGTPAVFDPPRNFVAWGPYRYARNPMYVGGLLLLGGLGLYLRSVSIILLSLVLLLVIHLFVVFVEEPGLLRRFGESYLAYKSSTNRWIPRKPLSASPRSG